MQIILASHSQMAKGLKQTVELIMGKQSNLHAIAAYDDEQESLKKQIADQITSNSNEKYLFLTDIIGGSVNTTIAQMIDDKENMFLVTGMNLPLVLTVLTAKMDNCSSDQVANKLEEFCEEARKELKVVRVAAQEAEDF
ncbi:PTS sugar transporter subunit IIA [Lactobacillus sp. ESL0260]|uniref:PTS Man IIA n=1 Tax=Lactobacillus melliventris TaxID=1218507 RepID=A0A0F4LI66_9LACO|nr:MULTISPECIES: PTS sugar transporter subunit IIA [Lactobacillus]KJY58547.1 PTS Man IIA [Lactobacillus melliventris]RMC60723.1 PTS sugar transporter subunit IIA [Lactobacillus sp. ESL0260]RMC62304.1 PTS sugar transporter subunit IIA [Lactobacillus sp. ESL0259]